VTSVTKDSGFVLFSVNLNVRTHDSGSWNRGSNPCFPASLISLFSLEIKHFPTNRQTENFRQLVAILVILCDISVTWGEVYIFLPFLLLHLYKLSKVLHSQLTTNFHCDKSNDGLYGQNPELSGGTFPFQ